MFCLHSRRTSAVAGCRIAFDLGTRSSGPTASAAARSATGFPGTSAALNSGVGSAALPGRQLWDIEKLGAAPFARWELKHLDRVFDPIRPIGGKIDMIKDLPPPTEAEEYRGMAEILRDLAAQVRFHNTRNELVDLADNLDRLAAHSERQICSALE
jgi:hypothetical protein